MCGTPFLPAQRRRRVAPPLYTVPTLVSFRCHRKHQGHQGRHRGHGPLQFSFFPARICVAMWSTLVRISGEASTTSRHKPWLNGITPVNESCGPSDISKSANTSSGTLSPYNSTSLKSLQLSSAAMREPQFMVSPQLHTKNCSNDA